MNRNSPTRIFLADHVLVVLLRQVLRNQACFRGGLHIDVVKEPALQDQQVANLLKPFGDADQGDRLFLAIHHHVALGKS